MLVTRKSNFLKVYGTTECEALPGNMVLLAFAHKTSPSTNLSQKNLQNRVEVCVFTDLWLRILKYNRKHHTILGRCMFASKLVSRWLHSLLILLRKISAGKLTIDLADTKNLFSGKRTASFSGSYLQVTVQIDCFVTHRKSNEQLTQMQS